jgi:hypothetical protein
MKLGMYYGEFMVGVARLVNIHLVRIEIIDGLDFIIPQDPSEITMMRNV